MSRQRGRYAIWWRDRGHTVGQRLTFLDDLRPEAIRSAIEQHRSLFYEWPKQIQAGLHRTWAEEEGEYVLVRPDGATLTVFAIEKFVRADGATVTIFTVKNAEQGGAS